MADRAAQIAQSVAAARGRERATANAAAGQDDEDDEDDEDDGDYVPKDDGSDGGGDQEEADEEDGDVGEDEQDGKGGRRGTAKRGAGRARAGSATAKRTRRRAGGASSSASSSSSKAATDDAAVTLSMLASVAAPATRAADSVLAPAPVAKARVDSLWAELNAAAAAPRRATPLPAAIPAAAADVPTPGAAPVAAAKKGPSALETVLTTKTYRFAGQDVQYEEAVPAAGPATKKAKSGLDDLLGSIGKKDKLTVIEKSKLDWGQFVRKEGLSDELKQHNKDGYLERQAFLDRAAERAYEAERAQRLKDGGARAPGDDAA